MNFKQSCAKTWCCQTDQHTVKSSSISAERFGASYALLRCRGGHLCIRNNTRSRAAVGLRKSPNDDHDRPLFGKVLHNQEIETEIDSSLPGRSCRRWITAPQRKYAIDTSLPLAYISDHFSG